MLKHFAIGTATLLSLAASASAREGSADIVSDFMLRNGMQVVVIEDHRAPVVVQMVYYRAGAADEEPGVSGVAHFLEHLMFKATDTLNSGEFSKTVARNGGSDNAFTTYDYTGYFQRVAADRLPLMMQMEADRMVNLRLRTEDIATERDVILEERSQRTDSSPQALFGEQMSAAQYMNSGYGIPVIGWRQEMEKLDLDDANNWYRTHYAPNNATLIVAGDVTPDRVKELAQTYYGEIPSNPEVPERIRPSEPPQLAARRVEMQDPRVSQPYLYRTYLAVPRQSGAQKQAAALTMLAQVLGGGQTGYLADQLVFEGKIATYAAAFYRGSAINDTTFGLYVIPGPGIGQKEAETALDQALRNFISEGVKEEDLERIRMRIRAGEIYERDDVAGMARMYGAALSEGLTVEDVQSWPDILQDVSADDVIAAAKAVLRPETSVTGWLSGPDEKVQEISAPSATVLSETSRETGEVTQ